VAMRSSDGRSEFTHILDLARNRLTQSNFEAGYTGVPVWSPNGGHVLFAGSRREQEDPSWWVLPVAGLVMCVGGGLIGALVMWKLPAMGQAPAKQEAKAENAPMDLAALNNEVTRLKNITPSPSHVMEDVSFHYSNLWFAGQKKNWPLAMFYYNETRSHIRWLLRINPNPKTPQGEVVNLQGIFDGIDTSSLATLKKSIEDQNLEQFTANYKLMLEACYSCHKSAGRAYLRPMIPTAPPQSVINYSPDANWPS